MNIWDKTKPLPTEYVSDFFSAIRNFLELFLDRFGLDHNMDSVNDTTLATADGYHKKLTMPDFNYPDGYGGMIKNPVYISNSYIPYVKKIDGLHELCVRKSDGIYKITKNGGLSIGEVFEQESFVLPDYPNRFAYFLNTFIILTSGGKIYTSSDGESWTLRTSGWASLVDISFSGSTFVVTAEGAYVLTSNDLVTWTQQSVTSMSKSCCAYGAGLFVAICANGRYYTSSNGSSWTFRGFMTSYPLVSIVFYNGIFVAVGNSGLVAKSSDGINWTYATISTQNLKCITAGSGKFVIVGGTAATSSVTFYSADAVSWTSVNNVILTAEYNFVRFFTRVDKTFFIASTASSLSISYDGITWSLYFSGFPTTPIYSDVAFSERVSLFLSNKNIIKSSYTKIG